MSAGQIVRDQPGVKEQVGIYLDESPISLSLFTPDLDFFDTNRVEVLRGPQGTLFGSGSLSGTVRYITNKPNFDDYEVIAEATGNVIDHGDVGGEIKAAFNVPVNDVIAIRAVGYATRYGGFINAVQPGGDTFARPNVKKDVNDGVRYGGRLAAEIRVNDRITLRPRVVYQKVEIDGFNRVDLYNILANPFTTTRPRVTLGRLDQFTQLEETFRDEFLLADAEVTWEGDVFGFKSISSFTNREILQVRDATQLTGSITFQVFGAPEPIVTLDSPLFDRTNVDMFTEEARFYSTDEAARLQWVLGVFYSNINRRYGQTLFVDGFEDLMRDLGVLDIDTRGVLAPKDVLFFSDIPY
ncbi:MAG: TonB-dependent receptor, partial [Deltaproteobacteria bacterium]